MIFGHLECQINEFVKRARAAKVHAHIVSHLKKEMPALMGKAKAQQKLLDSLDEQFAKVITGHCSLLSSVSEAESVPSLSYHAGPEGAALATRGFS